MIKCILYIIGFICISIKCQKLTPCPGVFNYDQNNYEGRWDGQIRLQTDEELSGVFVTIVLDQVTEKLVNWFGDSTTSNNKEFTIRNNDYILVPGINVTLKFYVEYHDAKVPSITTIRLNGRTICSETKKVKPIPSPAPFTSIKVTPRTTARFVIPTTSSQYYRHPSRTELSGGTEYNRQASSESVFRTESSEKSSYQNKFNPVPNVLQSLRSKSTGQEYDQNAYVPTVEPDRASGNKNKIKSINGHDEFKIDNGNAEVKFGNRNGGTGYEETTNAARQTYTTTRKTTSRDTTTDYNVGEDGQALSYASIQSSYKCGKPSHIKASALILNGQNSTEGEWPWHLAIYKNLKGVSKYICGGSLISNNYVITAAHCVTAPGGGESLSPNNLVIYIGTTSIKNFSPGVQIVQVSQIKVHPDYKHENFHNDIALLKTLKPIEYTNNVIPVCLWEGDSDLNEVVGVLGTVVGWGFDESNRISEILKQTEMPIVDSVNCIYSKPDFFSRFTSSTSFCAGFRNGSNACNGDSGSGMVIGKRNRGGSTTWYLRGLVSTGVPIKGKTICDPYNYIIFTDAAKFVAWIRKVIKNDDDK